MKTILQVVLFLSILIINVESYPQLINNFSDFPWKSSKENVMSLMCGLDSVKLNSEGNDFIVFENGIFGDFLVKYWDYRFYNNSLYSVIIVIDSTTIYDTLKIENLKNFIRQQHIIPFGNSVLKLDYNWLLSDTSGNLIGIIDIESDPTLTFGNRIRVVFRYYSLLLQLTEEKKFKY